MRGEAEPTSLCLADGSSPHPSPIQGPRGHWGSPRPGRTPQRGHAEAGGGGGGEQNERERVAVAGGTTMAVAPRQPGGRLSRWHRGERGGRLWRADRPARPRNPRAAERGCRGAGLRGWGVGGER